MKISWYLGMFLTGALVAPPTARAEVVAPEELIGQWVNPVPTGSLTRIQIENGSPGWSLRACRTERRVMLSGGALNDHFPAEKTLVYVEGIANL